jgi:hypothetical protein
MKNTLVEALVAAAMITTLSSPAFAKNGNKSKPNVAPLISTPAPAPKSPATVHTGVFTVEAGGVIFTCHNYCAGNTQTTVESLY